MIIFAANKVFKTFLAKKDVTILAKIHERNLYFVAREPLKIKGAKETLLVSLSIVSYYS